MATEKVFETSEKITKQIEENPDLIKKLNHVEPKEKNTLPTQQQIEEEKKLEQVKKA